MTKYLTIRIEIPEDYEDVCRELILEDFIDNPKAWKVDILSPDILLGL